MRSTSLRLSGCALALAAVAIAPAARAAVDFTVALTPSTPPLVNALVQGQTSPVFYDVTNQRDGTTVTQIDFTLPFGFFVNGGSGPAGWIVARSSRTSIHFKVATCGQGDLAPGASGTFRIDAHSITNDASDSTATYHLTGVAPADPCGGTSGWTPTSNVPIPLEMLAVTASASPSSGAAPLVATVTFGVANHSSGSKTLAVATTVTPVTGVTPGGCSPASLVLTRGSTGTFTCSYTFAPASLTSYAIAGTVSGTGVSSGAVAGPVLVGPATATFAFDDLSATTNDVVRATLAVTNNTGGPLDVAPPTYARLSLQNLVSAAGAVDPAPVSGVPAGATQTFVYSLTVTGAFGASYVASGTAAVTGGTTNLAITPSGTVAGWSIAWTPAAIVPVRATQPYTFTVSITNLSPVVVRRIRISNPQNGTWVGLANVSASGLTYAGAGGGGSTDTLTYSGTLGQNASATVRFSFTAIPGPPTTTSYPFQVIVYGSGNGILGTVTRTVAVTVPIDDVASFTIQSTASGQTLFWGNTSRPDALHDGVVVFRVAAPAVPPMPQDLVDYTVPANQPAGFLYADRDGSAVATLSDPVVGAYNYRVCNHDANLVYSDCNSGFWNNAGWLDSAVAPAGGWTHALGGAIFLRPGLIPGAYVTVATNAPAVVTLDAVSGGRAHDPVGLSALPSRSTPTLPTAGGGRVLYAADQNGSVTAVDVTTGSLLWTVAKAGEVFVAGVSATLRGYASAAFQAAYAADVLYLGSTSGRLLALDAADGSTLWTLNVGAPIRAAAYYDYGSNRLFVPSDGGIPSYDLGTSGPTAPPSASAGWTNPGGTYTLGCSPVTGTSYVAVADTTGLIRLVDQTSGAVASTYPTGLSSPAMIWPVPGGLVVSDAATVLRLGLSGTTISLVNGWTPGLTLGPPVVFPSTGTIYVGASDRGLHKLRLADATDTGQVAVMSSQAGALTLAPPVYDVVTDTFIFGGSDSRLWALKAF